MVLKVNEKVIVCSVSPVGSALFKRCRIILFYSRTIHSPQILPGIRITMSFPYSGQAGKQCHPQVNPM